MRGCRIHHYVLASLLSIGISTAGCSRSGESSGKSYEDYPEFREGGEIMLTMEGDPYTLRMNEIFFANTDEGYPDYIEINGVETKIVVECRKDFDLDFDTDHAYDPIINAPLPVGTLGFEDTEMRLNLPGLGVFTVTGGSLTLLKYQIGRDGRDWWDGKISLTIETDQGEKVLPGTFSWCIVPVW